MKTVAPIVALLIATFGTLIFFGLVGINVIWRLFIECTATTMSVALLILLLNLVTSIIFVSTLATFGELMGWWRVPPWIRKRIT